jgi:PPP family 3-phenylpropionic acid transporter
MATRATERPRRGGAPLWLNGAYFWYFASIGCFGPYIALYYRELQLTGPQIGVLAAIPPLGVAALAPLWGSLADTFAAHRLALRLALGLGALLALLMASAGSFAALAPLLALLAACLAVIPALLDGYAVMVAERSGGSYGQIRVWGTVGFIVGAALVGWLLGPTVTSGFLIAYAVALLLALLATLGLPPLQPRASRRPGPGAAAILAEPAVRGLLVCVFLVVINATIMASYLGLYLTALGGDVALVAAASILGALSEVPVMILGGRLLRRFTSQRVLVAAVAMYLLRLLLYSIPPVHPWAVAVQLLHGASFGLYLMASVTLMHELVGQARVATGQGLLNAVAQGGAAVTGALIGGLLLDRLGPVGLFRVAAAGMAVALFACARLLAPGRPWRR